MTINSSLNQLAENTLSLHRRFGWELACAESCTGGLLSGTITSVPGSSDVFVGGVIAYANRIKRVVLEVDEQTLEQYGAVSETCALEMVNGVKNKMKSDTAISVTGIAGPGGGRPGKPVGRVYIGYLVPTKQAVAQFDFSGDRSEVRRKSIVEALKGLNKMMDSAESVDLD